MTAKAVALDIAGEEMMSNSKTNVATNSALDEAKEEQEPTQEEVEPPNASKNPTLQDQDRSSQPGTAESVLTPPTAGKVVYDIDIDLFAPTPQSVRTHLHETMDVNTAIWTDPPSTADNSRPYRELWEPECSGTRCLDSGMNNT
jgi:hypothetical protein